MSDKPESAPRYTAVAREVFLGGYYFCEVASDSAPYVAVERAEQIAATFNSASQHESEREQDRATMDTAIRQAQDGQQAAEKIAMELQAEIARQASERKDTSYQLKVSEEHAANLFTTWKASERALEAAQRSRPRELTIDGKQFPVEQEVYAAWADLASRMEAVARQLDERTNDWATATRCAWLSPNTIFACQLPAGHSGNHQDRSVFWDDSSGTTVEQLMAERDAAREQLEAVTRERDAFEQAFIDKEREAIRREREVETLRTALRQIRSAIQETSGCYRCELCRRNAEAMLQTVVLALGE